MDFSDRTKWSVQPWPDALPRELNPCAGLLADPESGDVVVMVNDQADPPCTLMHLSESVERLIQDLSVSGPDAGWDRAWWGVSGWVTAIAPDPHGRKEAGLRMSPADLERQLKGGCAIAAGEDWG